MAQIIGGFNHVVTFISLGSTEDHQGADTKVVCAKVGRIVGEVSAIFVPRDFGGWVASNRTAHAALGASDHHVRLQGDKESWRLVLIYSLVPLWSDLNVSWWKKEKSLVQHGTQSLRRCFMGMEVRAKDWLKSTAINVWHSAPPRLRCSTPVDCNCCSFSNRPECNLQPQTLVSAKFKP